MSILFEKTLSPCFSFDLATLFHKFTSKTSKLSFIAYLTCLKRVFGGGRPSRDILKLLVWQITEPQFVDAPEEFESALDYARYWLSNPAAQKHNPLMCAHSPGDPLEPSLGLYLLVGTGAVGVTFVQDIYGPVRFAEKLDEEFELTPEDIDRRIRQWGEYSPTIPKKKKTIYSQTAQTKCLVLSHLVSFDETKKTFQVPRGSGDYILGIAIDDSQLSIIEKVVVCIFVPKQPYTGEIQPFSFCLDLSKLVEITPIVQKDPAATFCCDDNLKLSDKQLKIYTFDRIKIIPTAYMHTNISELTFTFRQGQTIDESMIHFVMCFHTPEIREKTIDMDTNIQFVLSHSLLP